MPFELNEKIRNLVPYDPIAGEYPVRLDANESFLPVGEEERAVLLACAERVDLRRYPDPAAGALCAAAAAYYDVPQAQLTAWNGLDEAILLLSSAFLGKGNTLLCYALDFSMYAFNARLSGAACVKLPKRADFSIDADAAIAALEAHRPAMFLFSNPCNPTSIVLPREDVRRIVRAAQNTGAFVALDEAYMDFSDQSLLGEAAQYDNLAVLRTCSKAPGLAGLRLGFSVANPAVTQALHAVKSPYNVGVLTQAVGEAILRQPERLHAGVAAIRQSAVALSAGLDVLERRYPERLHVAGDAANFVFVAMPEATAAFEYLKARGVIVRRFGETALRITAGAAEENAALLAGLGAYLGENGFEA
ncbi:MAG: aminotransferase class I/II-fold pyridoxal phosphate-dependent enzyme [Oscillospiraceae bacterium]|jgi:histidinol-phosphate aminotransferase|nr:aminotransferase class I/II-fold pyridoxal phosphate-dependent enzyme [Oscillospiraceae bacterium]